MLHPEQDLSSTKGRNFVVDLDESHKKLWFQIAEAQKHYQGPADARQTLAPDFKVGDLVFVKAAHFRTTQPSKKLFKKNLEPYEIIAKVRKASFTLQLPNHLRTVHPIFHVSQLEPATLNTIPNRVQSLPLPIEVDKDIEYKISQILDSKLDKWRKCQLLYLIRWAGYKGTDQETDWLPAMELKHAVKLVQDFHESYLNKPGQLNSLWKTKTRFLLLWPHLLCTPTLTVSLPLMFFLISFAESFDFQSYHIPPHLRASGFGPKRRILLYTGISYWVLWVFFWLPNHYYKPIHD